MSFVVRLGKGSRVHPQWRRPHRELAWVHCVRCREWSEQQRTQNSRSCWRQFQSIAEAVPWAGSQGRVAVPCGHPECASVRAVMLSRHLAPEP